MKSKEFFKNSFDYILMRKLPVLILKGFLERREKETMALSCFLCFTRPGETKPWLPVRPGSSLAEIGQGGQATCFAGGRLLYLIPNSFILLKRAGWLISSSFAAWVRLPRVLTSVFLINCSSMIRCIFFIEY